MTTPSRRLVHRSAFLLVGIAVGALSLRCIKKDDDSVEIVTSCDLAKLDPSSPSDETVQLYMETGTALKAKAADLVEQFRGVCNAIDRDLGLPEGADVHTACNPVADRVQAAIQIGFVNGKYLGSFGTPWVRVLFDETCGLDTATEAKCIDRCASAPGCDPTRGCAAPTGKCNDDCIGSCATSGDNLPCSGACTGTCQDPPRDAAPEAGVPSCLGSDGRECIGKCLVPSWQGRCSTGCGAGFRGHCDGTCTGSCDGVAYPSPDGTSAPDAGNDASDDGGGSDAGDAGVSDAAAPPGSGTCAGTCTGSCVGTASGSCTAVCAGDYAGGGCPVCVGSCTGIDIPCTTTCTGTCKLKQSACAGTCTKCSGALADPQCRGDFTCGPDGGGGGGEATTLCRSICRMQGVLATQCGKDPHPYLQVAGDYELLDALRAHASDFSALVREADILTGNVGGVTQRTLADFQAIGVVYDNTEQCAKSAMADYDQAYQSITDAVGASQTIRGTKF